MHYSFMEFEMRQFVYDSWNSVMNAERKPSETYSRFADQTYDFTNSCMDVGNDICTMDGKYVQSWYINHCTLKCYRSLIQK